MPPRMFYRLDNGELNASAGRGGGGGDEKSVFEQAFMQGGN